MFNNLSLRKKIFLLVFGVIVVSFIIMTRSVSLQTYEMAKTDAFNLAQETADKYQNEIRAELQGARVTAETLSYVFSSLKEMNLTDRTMMDNILKSVLSKKEYITAFCIAYAPNALDGKDHEFSDLKPNYNKSGRYAPYWNKLGDHVAVEPLPDEDIDDITGADWWKQPRDTKQEMITNPYPYQVQGNEVMLESFFFPIIHQDKFIGLVASDIVLDKLQDMVEKVNPHNQGGVTEIFSNNGIVAAHTNKNFRGKDIVEVLVYELLTRHRFQVPRVIAAVTEYLHANPVKDPENQEETNKFNHSQKFLESLNEFSKQYDTDKLDLSLLNSELAMIILKVDPVREKYAHEIKEYIRNNKPYAFTGKYYYTVYIPIKFSEGTAPWSVAVSIPISKVLNNAKAIRNYVIVASVITVCVIAIMLYIVTGNVTRPILKLAQTAKILGEGNFNAEVPIVKSKDEIGILAEAFKFMVDKNNLLIQELQNSAKALEEKNIYLNRLNELKDEFLANTSHELRTPINGIIGIVESMIDGATGQLSDEQKYNLAIVSNSGKRLSNMINDILDFTKLKNKEIELQLKPMDLKIIVDTVIVLSKPLIKGKELTLVNEISDSLPLVYADENRIQQILYNLIGNAIKFTEKGSVTVSAQEINGMITVSVQDTGIGIPEDKFEKIFESFEQADGSTARKYGGTGLGLSISKKMIELHGGTINVQSKIDEGSRFTFTLLKSDLTCPEFEPTEKSSTVIDIEKFASHEISAVQEQSAVAAEGSHRILIVDDEPVNIQVLINLLSIRNYTVVKAYNGLEALTMFEKSEKFDLVLLDVMMPKMSGYDVCRHLRSQYSLFDLPIIMLTAKNQIQDIVLGFQAGANDYIQKPFDKEELLARMKTLLELKEAMLAATAANKTKSLFLANMSHELRTPLNAVIGLTGLMLKTPMNDRQRDYTEKMRQASSSLLGIVNNILDYSKVDSGMMKLERVSFDLRKMLDDLAEYFHQQYSDSPVVLCFELDSSIPSILSGDSLRLKQVFINLIDNAYKFTEEGSITVRALVVRSDPNNVQLDFMVEDTGIGINQELMNSIFTVFNQADNSSTRKYGGVGIGLTITRDMVELMGGTISVSSKEGEGTKFTFSCPFSVPEDVPVENRQQRMKMVERESQVDNQNNILRGMRVLLVEDNKVNMIIVTELLKPVGVIVTVAQNGREALDKLAETVQQHGQPAFDVILMDLQMPVMDGYEATRIIKNTPEYKDIPVFALTAHAFAEEKESCLRLGMQEHLTKPIDVNLFYETLQKVAPKHTK